MLGSGLGGYWVCVRVCAFVCVLKLSINHWMPLALGSVCQTVCVYAYYMLVFFIDHVH